MYHAPESLPTPSYPSPYQLLPHHAMSKCDKTHHLWITSNDHFTTKFICFLNQKIFGCYTSMIIYIPKSCVFLWIANFRGLTIGFVSLPTLSRAFTVGHLCLTKNNKALIRGGIYPYLLLPDTYFHFHVCNRATLLNVVPPYRAHPIKHQTQC